MGTAEQETHRSGQLKQSNKTHKTGRHRSKGSINSAVKGKVNKKSLTKRAVKELGKNARRHQLMQLRKQKREEVLASKRKFGSVLHAPVLITVIPLAEDVDTSSVVSIITSADETAILSVSPCGATHICVPKLKQRFSFLAPPVGNTMAILDAVKVSTAVLFVASATEGPNLEPRSRSIDDTGSEIISHCLAQGLPTTITAITNLEHIRIKKRQEAKHHAQDEISKWLPDEKIMPLNNSTDAFNLLRRAGSQKQKNVTYRNKRSHLLAENIKYVSGENDFGSLEVTGFLRGKPLSVNSLVHIPGFGEYQLSEIRAPMDPYSLDQGLSKNSSQDLMDNENYQTIAIADPSHQESLESENIPDPMDAEQTWPTNEEIAQAEAQRERKIVKLVPKGTSIYQAAWIPDEDAKTVDDHYDSEEDDNLVPMADAESEADSNEENEDNDNEDYETVTVSEAMADEQRYDQQIDLSEEQRAMENIKMGKLDAQFPDEVDTPVETMAKVRFQKYRGLESFRTSPWDPKESLPSEYGRIFQFENFDRTRRRVYRESEAMHESPKAAQPECYVTLCIKNVSQVLFDAYRKMDSWPLTVFGLLPYEQKMSFINIVLKRTSNSDEPIKSKQKLLFQCGFRRFTACPVFSQHTNGSKHKYERYFQPNSTVVASLYAPVTFPPCPVMCYMEHKSGELELVATGSILSVNPDRLIIKRAVLSGHPFKVHKRSAVVRFMFFNRDDIIWFKPVQLRTKYGRRGHIKEPLGTHGHMKCVFDGQMKSQDTVLLNLYKRIFPKWTYEPYLVTKIWNKDVDDDNMEY